MDWKGTPEKMLRKKALAKGLGVEKAVDGMFTKKPVKRKRYPIITRTKAEFYAANRDGEREKVMAYPVILTPWLDGFIYRHFAGWCCAEVQTGIALDYGKTVDETAKNGRKFALDEIGRNWIIAKKKAQESQKGE